MPGWDDRHGSVTRQFFAPFEQVPQLGIGGRTPSPRKLKIDSITITLPTKSAETTESGAL